MVFGFCIVVTLFSDFMMGLRLSLRAHFSVLLAVGVVLLIVAVLMAAQFSGRQPATVGLDVGFSVIRLVLPLVVVLGAQELFSREFDRRYFLLTLSYPRRRSSFIIGRFSVLFFIVFVQLLVMCFVLVFLVREIGSQYEQAAPPNTGLKFVGVFLFYSCEAFLLASLATLLAVVASTPGFVLIGVFGFVFIARSYSAVLALLAQNAYVIDDAQGYKSGLGVLGYLLPDLGRLDIRMVALYDKIDFLPDDSFFLIVSVLAYSLALLAISVFVLQRKRFS